MATPGNITDPTVSAKIKELLEQAGLPKTVIGKDAGMQASLGEVLERNSNDQRNWVMTNTFLSFAEVLQTVGYPPCPTENTPKTLSAWLNDAGLKPWQRVPAQCDVPIGNAIQFQVPLLGEWMPWFVPV